MSSYKDYMNRIRVSSEQHEQLMDAVLAAQKAAENGAGIPSEEKKTKRFPVKRLALIASAAAVIVLFVGVFPGGGINTRSENKVNSITLAKDEKRSEQEFSGTDAANGLTAETEAPMPQAQEDTAQTAALAADTRDGNALYSQTAAVIRDGCETVYVKIGPLSPSFVPAEEPAEADHTGEKNAAAPAAEDLPELIRKIISQAEETTNSGRPEYTSPAEYRIVIGEKTYGYSTDGVLEADGKIIVLTPEEKEAVNRQLKDLYDKDR